MKQIKFATLALGLAALVLSSEVVAASTLVAHIDISTQKMQILVDGRVAHQWAVSTGRGRYRTPTGTYAPIRMHKRYFSKKYDNAPMPYSVFFHRGYAIHGTTEVKNLGRPASHGCVRLHPENAKQLFALIQQAGPGSTQIRITR
jgi:lipoprotein-anchoring transpeptidase ErfK/SrfK